MQYSPGKVALLFILLVVAFVSCKKSDSPSPNGNSTKSTATTAAPVDTIVGTYNGYMHVYRWSMFYSDTSTISITDTTYPFSITIHKIAADSFVVGDSLVIYWRTPYDGTYTAHIHYDTSNNYYTLNPNGENDTVRFVPSADSMYFSSHYHHPGGATTDIKTQTFTGKK